MSWGDQHGVVRGKTLTTHDFLVALRNGQDFQSATLYMDTTNNLFAPMFASGGGVGMTELAGGPDTILVPDPTTFRVLPWTPKTGWVLADMYFAPGSTCRSIPAGCSDRCSTGSAGRATSTCPGSKSSGTSPSSKTPCSSLSSPAGPGSAEGERGRARLPVPHRAPKRRDRPNPSNPAGEPARPGAAAAHDGGRVGSGSVRVHLRPRHGPGLGRQHAALSHRCQAAVPPQRLSRDVHDQASAAQLLLQWLAPAPVAAPKRRRQRVHQPRRRRPAAERAG